MSGVARWSLIKSSAMLQAGAPPSPSKASLQRGDSIHRKESILQKKESMFQRAYRAVSAVAADIIEDIGEIVDSEV